MRTFKDLLDRVAAVQGVPFIEIAQAHEIQWNPEPVKNKGLGGRIVEAAMGIAQNPRPEADLTFLGLEIKTIPIGEGLKVQEMTKINMVNFSDVIDEEFEISNVYHKLRSIIFVPVVKHDLGRPDQWYIRSPFIWMPSDAVQRQLKADYEAVRALLRSGEVDRISSKRPPEGQGVYMTANTAGKDSKDVTTFEIDGRRMTTKRRAWMLRRAFTTAVVRENIAYSPDAATNSATAFEVGLGRALKTKPGQTRL